MLTLHNDHAQIPNVFVKVLGEAGVELDSLFSRLAGATAEDSLEDFLGCIIRDRYELVGKQPRHIRLFYRNGSTPPTQADILKTMLRDPHVEQADFPTLRDFLAGHSLSGCSHFFVALVLSLSLATLESTGVHPDDGSLV